MVLAKFGAIFANPFYMAAKRAVEAPFQYCTSLHINVLGHFLTSRVIAVILFLFRCFLRGTQRIVSVNYLFGRPLIPSDFLETIITLNFRDMRNLMSVAFGLSKLSFFGTEKRSTIIFGKARRPKVFGTGQKNP